MCSSAAPHSPSHLSYTFYDTALSAIDLDWITHAHVEMDEIPICITVANKLEVVVFSVLFANFTDSSAAGTIGGSAPLFGFA